MLDTNISTAAAAKSQYQNEQRKATIQKFTQVNPKETCYYCGGTGHGQRPRLKDRRNTCKAFGHTCTKCGKQNHFESVCKSDEKNHVDAMNMICSTTTIGHHIYDKSIKK